MIAQSVKIHDRHQLELKLHYRLDDFSRTKAYDVSMYLFLPASLGISPETYSKRDFFSHLVGHIRVKTPDLSLGSIAGGEDSPLPRLESAARTLLERPTRRATQEFEQRLKMACCIVKTALRDHAAATAAQLQRREREDLTTRFLLHVDRITAGFRALHPLLDAHAAAEALATFRLVDEHLSLLVELNAFRMLEALRPVPDGLFEQYRGPLLDLVRAELAYRTAQGYPSLPGEGSNEQIVTRKSALKKYVESVLFLETRTRREGTLVEQTVLAASAGLSMIFATAVAFVTQRHFGNLTLPFFMALVVSYMFKDRIKDGLRAFLITKVSRFFFDRRREIFDDAGDTDRIGLCRESFDFVDPKRLLPAVGKLRDRDRLTELDNGSTGEVVVLYRKQIKLLPKWFRRTHTDYPIDGLNDIFRINFSEHLVRMDEPNRPFFVCSGDGYAPARGQRVYHINLILQYRSGNALGSGRYLLVLNKDGIQRVELLHAEHTLASLEGAGPEDAD